MQYASYKKRGGDWGESHVKTDPLQIKRVILFILGLAQERNSILCLF
jgi:hypothetical protein